MNHYHPDDPGWQPLDDPALEALLQPEGWHARFSPDVTLHARSLPFYPGHRLVMARCPHWLPANAALYWLLAPDQTSYRLNGVSPPIHEANAQSAQRLTEELAPAYLCFFGFFVRGEEGPFYIIDSLDAPLLPAHLRQQDEDRDPQQARERSALRRIFQGVRTFGTDENGHVRLSALVYYSNAVFVADFLVQASGMVEMQNDNPLIADLSTRIDAPLTLHASCLPDQAEPPHQVH